jgi:hypothetical protein
VQVLTALPARSRQHEAPDEPRPDERMHCINRLKAGPSRWRVDSELARTLDTRKPPPHQALLQRLTLNG